ncbi:hypothetical protein B7486_09705 [cyanobacterium TDX16]|nr:hypothetical protein B7486_09705 [cyanobacterium TDX16]
MGAGWAGVYALQRRYLLRVRALLGVDIGGTIPLRVGVRAWDFVPGKSTFAMKKPLLAVSVVAALVILALAIRWRTNATRIQVVGQTIAQVSMALAGYVEEFGQMPATMKRLEESGYIRRDDSGTRLVTASTSHPLFALDEVTIEWSFDLSQLRVIKGQLVTADDKAEEVFILKPKRLGDLQKHPVCRSATRMIYDAYLSFCQRRSKS